MGRGKSTNKSSLKSALQSQQSRLENKKKAAQAATAAEQKQKGKKTDSNSKGKALPPKSTVPFRPTDTILLVGEGNFSFARALVVNPPIVLEHLPAKNVTATAYDTREECLSKYPDAEDIVADLESKGVEVVFGVDASKLEKVSAFKGRKWDRIVWNYPHGGKGISDQDRNILSNQIMILGFLQSSSNFLTLGPAPSTLSHKRKKKTTEDEDEDDDPASDDTVEGKPFSDPHTRSRGTVLITLRNVPPYTLWDVPRLAKSPPAPASAHTKPNPRYALLRSYVFYRSTWKGYEHRMTKGERVHGQGTTGEGGEDRTWEFYVRDE